MFGCGRFKKYPTLKGW